MAIKINCPECKKKIAVDDAFAGGVCRCPYCTAMVDVPGSSTESVGGVRPEQPGGRPAEPGAARPEAPGAVATVSQPHKVVVARKAQGDPKATMILLAVLVLMVLALGGLWLHFMMVGKNGSPANDASDGNVGIIEGGSPNGQDYAVEPSGPSVVRMPIATPVVYIIDAGSSMRQMYDYADAVVRRSLDSLGEGAQFGLIVAGETQDKALASSLLPADEANRQKAGDFTSEQTRGGAVDLTRSFKQAMTLKPAAIVVLTRKGIEPPLKTLAGSAKNAGAKVYFVGLDMDDDSAASLADAASAGGGTARALSAGQLKDMLD